MKNRNYILIALISLSLISLELIWTRLFSAEFFYTFAFLILSLAVLGLGLGSLSLRFIPFLNNEKTLGCIITLAGVMTSLAPVLVFKLDLNFAELFSSAETAGKFAAAIVLLSSAYFFGGIAIAKIFKSGASEMPRIYMADLLGAGMGVIGAIALMNLIGTPKAVFFISIPIFIAAIIEQKKWVKLVPAVFAIISIAASFYADGMLEAKREEHAPVIYKHWDSMSKIKVYDYGDARGINIDNAANTPVYQFDGNWNRPDSLKFGFGIDVSYLIAKFDSCVFLSLGSGGGVDVLQALQNNAKEIHAVEVNPHINEMMLNGELAKYSGNIYKDPCVKVVTEDARAYVRRHKDKFDVIYSLSSNTFAALASGAFALAENYLFTTEAFADYWNSLSENGYMMMEHQFYTPRLVSEFKDAMKKLEVKDWQKHYAVYDLPRMRRKMILISKQPLTDEIMQKAFGELTAENYKDIHLLYPAPDSLKDNLINRIALYGWQKAQDSAKIDISPCDDNRPFTAQLGIWKNFEWAKLDKITPYEFAGFPLSKMIIVCIIFIVLVIILPLNLLPYLFKSEKLKPASWLYFFAIGAAFMSVEVILMQQYSLLIGPSAYSVAAVLFTLLISSGIGSGFANKFNDKTPFIVIVILLAMNALFFSYAVDIFGGLEIWGRTIAASILICPLGFFMGMPFPKGTLKIGELIDWGFAVNGAASVIGSTVIILVAVSYGFAVSLIIGGLLYLVAGILMALKKAW
jgi:spermidine synthase